MRLYHLDSVDTLQKIIANSMQVLERDLAIFGFFIALGRRTQAFISAKGFHVAGHPLEGFLRYRDDPDSFLF